MTMTEADNRTTTLRTMGMSTTLTSMSEVWRSAGRMIDAHGAEAEATADILNGRVSPVRETLEEFFTDLDAD